MVGLGRQNVASGQGVLSNKGMDGFLRPGRADAISQIEGASDLAPKAVDVQRNARTPGSASAACSWAAMPS